MEIQGKIIAVLPVTTGEGKNGTWRVQNYVLETMEQYPKKVCFELFGDKIDQFLIAIDDMVNVSFDINSREWNGRWFTSIRAWKVDKVQDGQSAGASDPLGNITPFDAPASSDADNGSDLPF